VGNFEDHLSWVSEADWIIEVVVEDLNLKRELFKKLVPFLKEGTVISSNTSGISIQKMCEGFSKDFTERFLGTHFFNPPRYMKLLEIIPIPVDLQKRRGENGPCGGEDFGKRRRLC